MRGTHLLMRLLPLSHCVWLPNVRYQGLVCLEWLMILPGKINQSLVTKKVVQV